MKPERWLATVLFTDIVGSTEKAAELGDRHWRELLQAHHALARREIERHGGRELNMTGDGFLATFEVPERAIRCAVTIRDAVRRLGLEIRSGLHHGEVELVGKSVGGIGVHIGARVAALATPGEVVVSSTVRDVVAGSGFEFEDRGSHVLKGVPGEWRLYAVTGAPVRLPVAGFWERLRESRLPRVLLVYAVACIAILWLAVFLRDRLGLPGWMPGAAVLLLLIGLVVVTATAWIQGHPITAARAEREEVPGSWELDLRDVGRSVARGRLPHLTWSRSILGGVFAFALLFGLAGLYVVVKDRGRSFAPEVALAGPEPALVVLPFRIVGPKMELWREGMVDLLSTNLDGAPGVRTVAPRTVLSKWRAAISENPEPSDEQALKVARDLGARHALLGSMVALGGEVRLTARVYDLRTGSVEGESELRGVPDSIPALVDRLSLEVLRQAVARDGGTLPELDLRRITTTSVPALKAYLEGEQEFRRSRWQEAMADFTRAVEADSTFALALYRLSLAVAWSEGPFARAAEYGERAGRLADRLPEREALLLRGYADPDWVAGIHTLEQLVQRYPDDAEGWYTLGDAYFHGGAQALYPLEKFRQAFRRALALDPTFGPAYIHLVGDAFARADSAEARQLISRHRRLDPTSPAVAGFDLAYALAWGDSASRTSARAKLGSASTDELGEALGSVRFSPDFWRQRIVVSRALTDDRHPALSRGGAHVNIFQTYVARGRLREAADALLGGREDELASGFNARMLLSFHVAGLTDAVAARNAAQELSADTSALSRLLLGAWAAGEGRWDDVDRAIKTLQSKVGADSQPSQGVTQVRPGPAAAGLRGYAAARRGETSTALRELQAALAEIPGGCPSVTCTLHGALRFEVAKLLLERREYREAERYLRSLEFTGLTLAELAMGRLYEALGQLDEARFHYERFVRRWRDCDPELKPLWEEGRRALERLRGVQKL